MTIDIFHFLDYRHYLRERVSELKSEASFNVRMFAERAGISAPGYLKMVTDGKRNLTPKTAKKFAHALELESPRSDYFRTLVLYNQTTDPDRKRAAFDRLMELRPRSQHFTEEKRIKRYFSQPHYVCIREMVALKRFREDYRWIARQCVPSISPTEAREAVATLVELGLLARTPEGRLVQAEGFVRTADQDTQAIEAYHFHEAMLVKARQALTLLPQEERNYYALTVPLPKSMFAEVVKEFYALRDRIMERITHAPEYDDVYHVNFQIFRATKDDGAKG
ncbi:MAG: TIGR02147 family protein [Deltaproteobacteria bacterium]|nr:TIGR02147 family protein [Deltaproteobacteria bacterium]